MKTTAVSLCLLLAAHLAAGAGEVAFTAKPSAVRDGDKVKISFAVSAFTDAEVSALDKGGRIVRHLAAGLLGPNAPEPFQKNSLKQELTWDGKDDAGKSAAGPLQVRVSIGLKPGLDRLLGWDGAALTGSVVGLAVDDKGEVYVLDSDARLKVYDRKGGYLRTIMPYPANLPRERVESMGQLEVEGERIPVVYSAHYGTLHPLMSGLKKRTMAFSPKGFLLMTSAVGTKEEHGMPRHLVALDPDGGAPAGMRFLGPRIRDAVNYLAGDGERSTQWFDHLAASPDGQWIYLNQTGDSRHFKRRHAVLRLKWTDDGPGTLFAGKDEPGADDEHFSDPQGIAVDKAGRLYVCDRGNGRVVVFSAEGKRLGQFAAAIPEQVAVLPSTGDVYVLSRDKDERGRGKPDTTLRRFSPWGAGDVKEQASQALKNVELIAVDPAAKPARLWLALSTGWGRPCEVRPVDDRGDRLELGPPITGQTGLEHPCELVADPARNRVIVRERDAVFLSRRFFQLDATTGKKTPLPLGGARQGPPIALDRDGNLYAAGDYSTKILCSRYDPGGKPLPFAATGSNQIPGDQANPHWARGIAVAPDGTVYVLRSLVRHESGQLDVYGPDGALRKADLIPGMDRGANGLGVDAAGNVYVGVNIKAKEQPYPPEFKDQVPAKPWWFWFKGKHFGDRPAPWTGTFYNPYLYHWGSIVKFGPEGGAFWGLRKPLNPAAPGAAEPHFDAANAPAGSTACMSACLEREARVTGARWFRHGFGVVASSSMSWGDPCCLCTMSGFAVDPYGRVFYPNPFRFCVEALDSGGNLLVRAGRYGNADSAGPGSKVPEPGIAFAWPAFVSQAGGRLYVSDSINQRVVVIRLDHAAEETCEVK